jgi:Fe-S oxidoreductase
MRLFSIFKSSKTVYFPGCAIYFNNKEYFELYKKILHKLGIEFKFVNKKICCGLPALELGYDAEARKIAKRNFEIFKEENITHIITSDPGCHKMFLQDYPNLIPDWNIKIENLWKIILDKLESKSHLIKERTIEKVTYQDSCYLGRYLDIYDEPRKILQLLGYKLVEMNDSRENAVCCGSCGQLPFINIDLANNLAKERILQAKRAGIKKIITNSINDFQILSKNSNGEIEIVDFSEILAESLGIGKKDSERFKEEVEEEEILDIIDKDLENSEINELIGEEEK